MRDTEIPAMKTIVKAAIFTVLTFGTAAQSIAAEKNFPGAPGVLTLAGKCSKLLVAKLDATKQCQNQLASVTLPNGRVTFIFNAGGKLLGFEGDGTSIKADAAGKASLPLSLVTTGVAGRMSGQVKVTGTCTFGNPYSGKPVAVQCSAKSTDSSFAANFDTNGKAPVQPKPPKASTEKKPADSKETPKKQ
ncbi:hypothetical protein [Oryzifoliimicrobium ureilyticus]|uniref:hypothetical protein n=1 Tax=Oryzifoliimicrobium ureilyticus TaxID=3113724 RepID=UPI0030761906